jgi:hypothetical protein
VTDSGNIDIGYNLSNSKLTDPSEKKTVSKNSDASSSASNKSELVRNENKSVYKNKAESQENFTKSNSSLDSKSSEKPKGFNYSPQDPVLESKLINRKPVVVDNKKLRKSPPEPSLRVKLSPKGVAINPRRVKPNIPGRLKSFFDDRIKMLDKLNSAIELESINSDELSLINEYSKNLLGFNSEFVKDATIAELLNITEDIVDKPVQEIIALLEDRIDLLIVDKDLQLYVMGIIQQLHHSNYFLASLLQLFMPLPLPYILAEIDEEFEEDEEELYKDDEEDFLSEEEKEEEDESDVSLASVSIKTKNFSKLHFIIKYYKKLNKLKLSIKGDPSATEIAIPVETYLEELLDDVVDDIDYFLRLWKDPVIRAIDTRILMVSSSKNLDKIVLQACNSILKTVSKSDIDLDESSVVDDDYKMF